MKGGGGVNFTWNFMCKESIDSKIGGKRGTWVTELLSCTEILRTKI